MTARNQAERLFFAHDDGPLYMLGRLAGVLFYAGTRGCRRCSRRMLTRRAKPAWKRRTTTPRWQRLTRRSGWTRRTRNLYVGRGSTYGCKGEYDKAIADCNEAIRVGAKDYNAFANRGNFYEAKGEHDKAIADLTEAIRLNASDYRVFGNRAWVYDQKGQLDKALADIDAAVKISPKSFLSLELRGRCGFAAAITTAASADLKAAVALDANDPAAKFEPLLKQPLTAAEIEHGQRQVRQMLNDRPAMTKYGERAAVLLRLGGAKVRRRRPAAGDRLGRDRAARSGCGQSSSGKRTNGQDSHSQNSSRRAEDRQSTDLRGTMGREAVFELYNITSGDEFHRLERECACGTFDEGRLRYRRGPMRVSRCRRNTGILHPRLLALGGGASRAQRSAIVVHRPSARIAK